jgi:hypothetical protein
LWRGTHRVGNKIMVWNGALKRRTAV